jgi:RNA polymerase sigma-70 factor, ECF subfamily
MTANLRPDSEFNELLALHQGQVFGYIFAATRNLHDAQDLYQETCVTAWRKFGEFRRGSNFAHWACSIARRKILMYQRKHCREKRHLSEHVLLRLAEMAHPNDAEVLQRRHEAMATCFAALNAADQRLVEICYGTEAKLPELVDQAGMQLASLYNAVSRIRRKLFHCIRHKLGRENR